MHCNRLILNMTLKLKIDTEHHWFKERVFPFKHMASVGSICEIPVVVRISNNPIKYRENNAMEAGVTYFHPAILCRSTRGPSTKNNKL